MAKLDVLTRVLANLPSLLSSGRVVTDGIYLTDFAVEIFSHPCLQIPAEAQLFVDFILQIGNDTTVKTLGPFVHESDSEWGWRLSGHYEINAKGTSVRLAAYFKVPEWGIHRVGSTKIDKCKCRMFCMRPSEGFSDILRDEDSQPIARITAQISSTLKGKGRQNELDSETVVDSAVESLPPISGTPPHFLSAESPRDMAALYDDLGDFLLSQFKRKKAMADIDEAIKNFQESVSLTPDGHPKKFTRLTTLGASFRTRFHHVGILSDLGDAIANFQQALLFIIPNDHPDTSRILNDLGNCFATRFSRVGVLSDLDEAIKNHQEALSLAPDGHSAKPVWLANLGTCLYCRFERTGVLCDLERGIKNLQESLSLTPSGDPDESLRLANLGKCFYARFERTGSLSDIEDAIKNLKKAVLLVSDGHPGKPLWLGDLGNSFQSRFSRTGVLSDLEEAIRYQQWAVMFTSDGHISKARLLNNLAVSLLSRFESAGVLDDLERGIKRLRQAVFLTPDGHPDQRVRLENLGSSLRILFERKGVLSDLEEAINNQQQAVLLIPDDGHPEKPSALNNLGISFSNRFEHTGDLDDLEEGIDILQQAVLITPDGHPDKPARLVNLGSSLLVRFRRTGDLSDLDQAVKNQQWALQLIPDGHIDKPGMLQCLGSTFQSRFEQTQVLDDIDEAIRIQQEAVSLTPDRTPNKPGLLHNLGVSFHSRFGQTKILSDIDEAIKYKKQAVLLIPDGHPGKPKAFDSLAVSYGSRYTHTKALDDFDASMSNFWSAADSNSGPPSFRFRSLVHWARLTSILDQPSALTAYRRAIELIPQIAWIGDPVSVRHFHLEELGDLPRRAAAFALDVGQPDVALEWLEQGRSIVWNQLLDLRASDESLRETHPEVYDQFILISRQLQSATIREQRRERSFGVNVSLEEETQQHHRLAEKWHSLVHHVRSLPGFEDFLLSRKVSSLSKAAESGPVVVINVHQQRCDALVLLKGKESVQHIPLKELSYAEVEEMLKWLKQDLAEGPRVRGEDRARKPFKAPGLRISKILSILFSKVVRPVLQDLDMMVRESGASNLPRIWWCPTGPMTFLPLHAAGVDTPEGRDEVSNYVVSSYIPTVHALLEARAAKRQPFNRLVGIAMSNNPPHHRLNPLPNAPIELEKIGQLFPAELGWTFPRLQNEQATIKQVLEDMANSSWVHLACHAEQDSKEPTQSGLWLHDGRFTIMGLISQRFENADLAFLSACQTATGDEKTSDEAVHITAAMLGAGYRSIIGTMWSIPDAVAPILAAKVYEVLLSGGRPDSEMAARALHEGVKELRKSEERSFYSWVPFVHYGL